MRAVRSAARLVFYLRKQLTRQPLAVPGSGGGTSGGPSTAGQPIGLLLILTKAS